MNYTVDFSKSAEKYLRAIRDKSLYRRIRNAVDALGNDPRPSGCTKLEGSKDFHRIRVGDYRIIYQIRDAVLIVLVVEIGHRREVYR